MQPTPHLHTSLKAHDGRNTLMWLSLTEQAACPAEAMRGTTMGYPNAKHAATPAVVQRHYGHIRMAALSLAGALLLP